MWIQIVAALMTGGYISYRKQHKHGLCKSARFFPCDALHSVVFAIVQCPSICQSVTCWYCL